MKPSAISFAALAIFLGGAASADEPVASASANGTKLQVKSQKLVQNPPHIHPGVLDDSKSDLRMIVSIGTQRIYLIKDNQVAFDTPISSAANGFHTPRGSFAIKEKIQTGKISNLYQRHMPFWMRIGETEFGIHEGELPGYPASHGCIRVPRESAQFIFDHVSVGTQVEVVNSWSPQHATAPQSELVGK
ncbi:MAG: L,D-transpeptidase [Verrucomicrobiaceae bacterium]